MSKPQRIALWDAIDRVVAASGGNPGNTSVARQLAVVEVEKAVDEELRQSRARVKELEQRLRWFRAAHLLVSMEYGWLRHPDRLKGDEFCYASLDMDRDEPVIYLLCSDTFAWGCADAERAEYVDAEKLLDIAKSDGWVGLMRWVQQRRAERGIQEEPMPQVAANFARYDRIKERAESAEARVKELESRSVGALEGHLAAARVTAQKNAARVKELEAENARLRERVGMLTVVAAIDDANQEGGPGEG